MKTVAEQVTHGNAHSDLANDTSARATRLSVCNPVSGTRLLEPSDQLPEQSMMIRS